MRAQAAAKEKPRRSGASLSGSQEAVSHASFIGCGQAPKRMRPPCHPTPLRSTGSGRRSCRRAFYGVKKCKKDAHFSFPTLAILSPRAPAARIAGPYVSIPDQLVDVEAQAVLDRGPATTPVPPRTRSTHFIPSPFLPQSLGNLTHCSPSNLLGQLRPINRCGPDRLPSDLWLSGHYRALTPGPSFAATHRYMGISVYARPATGI